MKRNTKLVLIDRDGVLNEDRPDSVKSPEELVLLPGAAEAVARLNRAGLPVAVVTNQSVVGRGLIDEAALARIHGALAEGLARSGARLDALIWCPDPPDRPTRRRKPGPGMLEEALARFEASPDEAVMIGDSLTDLQAAAAAGCARILVRTGKGRSTEAAGLPPDLLPVSVYDDLAAAVAACLAGAA